MDNQLYLHAFRTILSKYDDPTREGLKDTPKRMLKAWDEWLEGYKMDPKEILQVSFTEDLQNYGQMISLIDIPFISMCEHHLAPFIGQAFVSYIPRRGNGVVGVSKLARLVDCFAKRLQIQERLTNQIADSIIDNLKPIGVGVVLKAQHGCMTTRGVKKIGSTMVTSRLYGTIMDEDSCRNEFLMLTK